MGPEPAPLLPRYDVLARQDGQRAMRARKVNCNYFQMIENSVDQNHLKWLHRGLTTPNWEDGEINPQIFEHGVLNTYKRRVNGQNWAHVNFFVMPTMNKTGNVEEGHPTEHRASSSCEVMRWRVPIDDFSTIHYTVEFATVVDGKLTAKLMKDRSAEGVQETKPGEYRWSEEIGWIAREDQDRAAQESQGAIYDRTTEHLVTTDKGVILLRRIYKEGIDGLMQGKDPLGIIREPAKNELIRLRPYEEMLG
jgi:5,5'-dehydrodivanillate O-demethylase